MKGQRVAGGDPCALGFLHASIQSLPQGECAFGVAAHDGHFEQVSMPIRDQTKEDRKPRVRKETRDKSQNVVVSGQI